MVDLLCAELSELIGQASQFTNGTRQSVELVLAGMVLLFE